MGRRRYPKSEAALKAGGTDWAQLLVNSLQVDEEGGGRFDLTAGVLAGVTVTVRSDQIVFKGLSAEQERLVSRHCESLAKRLGRPVTLAG
ncbi:MAG TPA: hypothetical protein DEB46_05975 [Myxococcales bacterium]|nr:hypothetical protein [Myxococcales bacterium]HBU47840.1 hypothetical protein [Myxococcales bacterium]